MSMNRLRNVAVRIRPLAGKQPDHAGEDALDLPSVGRGGGDLPPIARDAGLPPGATRAPAPEPVPTAPRRVSLDAAAPSRRRQIWDLEDGIGDPDLSARDRADDRARDTGDRDAGGGRVGAGMGAMETGDMETGDGETGARDIWGEALPQVGAGGRDPLRDPVRTLSRDPHRAASAPVSQPPLVLPESRRVLAPRAEPGPAPGAWHGRAGEGRPVPGPADRHLGDPHLRDPHLAGSGRGHPGAPATGRARTRVLGFHAAELAGDPFGHPAAARGPRYPAGFLVVTDGPGRGAFFAVTTSVSSIGRGADQDVALDFGDESISREGHASVVYDAETNRFFLGHGNKANVVRRNDMPVLATEELAHGDVIRIGRTSLRFHAFCGADFTWAEEPSAHD